MTPCGLNLLLVEDHPALRKGLELLLRSIGAHIVGSAETVEAGCRLFALRRPDVVIVDYALGGERGTELIEQIRAVDPEARVVVYTGITDPEVHAALCRAGARAIALKASDPTVLFEAVRAAAAGESYVDPQVRPVREASGPRRLTQRQSEILTLLADGFTGDQAAEQLVLSPETVRTHIRNAMERLGARTRTHAVSSAARLHEIAL